MSQQKQKRSPIPATRDTFVHYLFGTPGNEWILLSFINALLEAVMRPLVRSVDVLTPFNPATFITEKYTILDVKATDKAGKMFAIEFQTWEQASFAERVLYNWAKIYSSLLKEGEHYRTLPQVISIVLLTFCFFRKLPQLLNPFYLTAHHDPKHVFSDALQIYGVEAIEEKIDQIPNYPKAFQRWLNFFYYSDKKSEKEMKVLIQGDPATEQAYEYYKKFCTDEELRRIDEIRQRHLHDYVSDVDDAFEKGLAQGEAKGKLEGKLEGLAEGEAKGKLEGQVSAILTVLKASLKKKVPQRIVNALKTRTDSIALESLLVKAANCHSFEEFEKELN